MTPEQQMAKILNDTQVNAIAMRCVMTLLMAEQAVTADAAIALMKRELEPIVIMAHADAVRTMIGEMQKSAARLKNDLRGQAH